MELHTDVPLRVHFRPSWLSNTARGASQGYSYLGAARTASSLHPLSARGRAHQSYTPTHPQAHPSGLLLAEHHDVNAGVVPLVVRGFLVGETALALLGQNGGPSWI